MWTCTCGVENEEEAFACVSCGGMKTLAETKPYPKGEEFHPMREEFHPSAREEMEKAYETLVFEEREAAKDTGRKVLRITVVSIMCIALALIALFSVISISGVRDTGPSVYISKCVGIWIRSIIMTQAVVIIGGIFLFLLRKSKEAKA